MYIIPHFRRLVFQLGLLCVVPGLAWSQLALVRVTSCPPQPFPGTCAIPATGTGNLIVVGLQLEGGSTATTVASITDGAGNLYTQAGAARSVDILGPDVVDIWYAKNSVAGATSITITTSAGMSNCAAVIWEYSGADPTAPLDQTSVLNSQPATASPSGAPVTTASANQVIISLADVAHSVSGIVSGNPFVNDSGSFGNGWAHLLTSTPGTYSPIWAQATAGTYASSTASFKAASGTTPTSPSNACDLALPYGTFDSADVQAAINMTLGISPCTANIAGPGTCNVVVVQRVINATLSGGTCLTGPTLTHSVALTWAASSTPNVTYSIYRSTTTGSYSAPLASSGTATSYTDTSVQSGQTYYYVVTAVGSGGESTRSNENQAIIPVP